MEKQGELELRAPHSDALEFELCVSRDMAYVSPRGDDCPEREDVDNRARRR